MSVRIRINSYETMLLHRFTTFRRHCHSSCPYLQGNYCTVAFAVVRGGEAGDETAAAEGAGKKGGKPASQTAAPGVIQVASSSSRMRAEASNKPQDFQVNIAALNKRFVGLVLPIVERSVAL